MPLKLGVQYAYKFIMISSSDHISGKTGLNNAITVYLSKGAGAAGTLATNSGASGSGTTELDSTNLPGWYQIILSVTDLNTLGDLGFRATATGADPTDLKEQVQSQIFPDLQLDNTGRARISNNLTENQAVTLLFPMTSSTTGSRQTGLAVTAQRSLGGAGYAPCVNSVSEIGTSGTYSLVLAAGDTNSSTVGVLLTATGANDLFIPVTPTT